MRLKIAYCGICGSDLHEYEAGPMLYGGCVLHDLMAGYVPDDMYNEVNRYTGARLPQIMGHEMSGTVVELGDNVHGFELGQRVTVNAAIDDRHHGLDLCDFCSEGRYNVCDRIHFYGVNSPHGGFAEEIVVRKFALVPLPDDVGLRVAALAEPLAVAAHMIRISGFQEGQDAVVFGAGPIGTALTFLLKDSGARQVIVSEVADARISMAKVAGADHVANPAKEKVVDTVRSLTGSGADVAFDACGLQDTLDAAIASVKTGGTIFNVALHEKPLQLNLNQLTMAEKKLMAGNAYTAEDFDRVVKLLSKRGGEIERFITAVVPLEDAVRGGFEEIVRNKARHNKILVQVAGDDQ